MRKSCLLCLALILGATPLWADTLLVGAVSPLGGSPVYAYYPISPTRTRAVEFTLTAAEYVTYVEVTEILGREARALDLSLQDALTGTITVFASQSFSDPGSAIVGRTDQLPVNLILGPGTYYLVVASQSTARWTASDGSITGGAGTALNGYWSYDLSSWTLIDQSQPTCFDSSGNYVCVAPMFGVYGSDAPIPEPASLFLLGTGLVGLARWRRRRG